MPGLKLRHFSNIKELMEGHSFETFLAKMGGPSVLHIQGLQPNRCRVVVTLLHGNEPSGLRALYRLLKEQVMPSTNIKVIVGSVSAARTEPMFTHRMLPGHRDLNRCFDSTKHDHQGLLASAIGEQIMSCSPEAIVDVHNTSGSGPSFCVSIRDSEQYQSVASHFSNRFIHTDIRLGSLMEREFGCPVVTVEAGGAEDSEADNNAYNGLLSFFNSENLFDNKPQLEMFNNPRRLELKSGTKLSFAEQLDDNTDLTIRQDIERFNFGITQPTDILGWITGGTLQCFKLDNSDSSVSEFFHIKNKILKTTRPLKFFMVTTKANIALSDCLLYFVEA